MSAIIWLRNQHVRRLLTAMALGDVPISHPTFDEYGQDHKKVWHLQQLLMKFGILEWKDPNLLSYLHWLREKVALCALRTEHLQVLRQYARWHQVRRLQERADNDQLRQGHARTSKQDTAVSIEFLQWIEQKGRLLRECTQAEIDEWIATGPTTRSRARSFVIWSMRNHHMPQLTFPGEATRQPSKVDQGQRLNLLSEIAVGEECPLRYRVAASIFLLYAQPVTRIVYLTTSRVLVKEDSVEITVGDHPVPMPEPFAGLMRRYIDERQNIATASNSDSDYLFPGLSPGQPIKADYLMKQLRQNGIDLRTSKVTALRELVQEMPPAVAAQALGFDAAWLEYQAAQAGNTWAAYPELRRDTFSNS